MNISLVDFKGVGLEVQNEEEIGDDKFEDIGNQLLESLSTSGFAYVVNHGIPQSRVDDFRKMGDEFFARSTEYKMKFCTRSLMRLCYDPMGQLKGNHIVPDLNEGIRFSCYNNENDQWPDVPHLKAKVHELQSNCKALLLRILKALGLAMKLKDKDLFVRAHNRIGEEGNMTCLKIVHYPAITPPLVENQMRCCNHSDFGSVTLLFQDDIGGLQIQSQGGDFVDVPYKAGTVIVNIADTLHHWTGGRLKSTLHHVIVPTDPDKRSRVRRSVVYFGAPNDDVLLRTSQFKDSETSEVKDEKLLTVHEFMMDLFRNAAYYD